MFACVKESLQTATACKKCLASLACCVTDSCSFCECRSVLSTRSVKDPKNNLAAPKRSRHRENFFVPAAQTCSGSPPPSRLRPGSSSPGSSNPRLKALIPSPLPFVCLVCVHCSCHCHPSSSFIPPVPLRLHGHPGVQGLRWKEGLQVGRLPAKVPHYFSEAVSKDLLQHVLALPRLPA